MPRDDLRIDTNEQVRMPQVEHQDCAAVLDDFVNRVANLPEEIKHMQEEIAAKDRKMDASSDIIKKYDESIQRWIRNNGSTVPNPKEDQMSRVIRENYQILERLQEEKVGLAQKALAAVDRHLRALDTQIKGLQERGEFPVDAEIQSILNRKTEPASSSRAEVSNTVRPASQVHTSTPAVPSGPPRSVSQQVPPQRMIPAQVQAQHMNSGMSASAPATPAAALILQRQQRESSAGAPPKRQRTGLSNAPSNPSGLARHSSIGPGTPKAGTPTATRAGSVQPRGTLKKELVNRKVAPHKQGGPLRKAKPGKSGLSRVKRTGNKNSPSSTNDSELSDADSASQEDEDEAPTPPAATRDADGDEDMADVDDEEGGDDKKYCTCQSVSYGDMVACDNESCPFEWFHWTCVGLTKEPPGTWICPVCTKDLKSKQT